MSGEGWLVLDQLERHDAWDRRMAAGSVVSALAGAIHEIQRERGLSSGYLSGRGLQFSEELAYQVTRTNQAFFTLTERLEDLSPSGWASEALSALGAAAETLAVLEGIRLPVRLVEIDNETAAEVQTVAIAVLLTAVQRVAGGAEPQFSSHLSSIQVLLTIKETLGRERALGAPVFARGGVKAHELVALRLLAAQRSEAVERLLSLAPTPVTDRWQKWEQSAVVVERERYRALMTAANFGAQSGPGAVYSWYEKSTAVIEELQNQCDAAVAEFSLDCADQQKAEDDTWLRMLEGWGTTGLRLTRLWQKALELRGPPPERPGDQARDTPLRAEIRRRRRERREAMLFLARDFQGVQP